MLTDNVHVERDQTANENSPMMVSNRGTLCTAHTLLCEDGYNFKSSSEAPLFGDEEKRVTWSDESSITIFCTSGRVPVWRTLREQYKPPLQWGGSGGYIMLWRDILLWMHLFPLKAVTSDYIYLWFDISVLMGRGFLIDTAHEWIRRICGRGKSSDQVKSLITTDYVMAASISNIF